jgi:dihydroorotase
VAFSDGTSTVQSSGLMLKALQYVKAIDKTIIQVPDDKSISASGLMNEGIISTQLGLPGKAAIAEELMVRRDIELANYTGSKVHITGITTAKSVEMIKEAKSQGVKISCSVTPAHLCFCDEDLSRYDTNLKLNPPLRTKADREALKQGLLDGTIDCIATHHLPEDIDNKIVEFEAARYGMIGLETAFGVVRNCLPQAGIEKLIEVFSTNARKIFDLPAISINKNNAACLTMFLPDQQWTVKDFQSRSKNSAFTGKQLTGRPVGIINQDKLFLNQF